MYLHVHFENQKFAKTLVNFMANSLANGVLINTYNIHVCVYGELAVIKYFKLVLSGLL